MARHPRDRLQDLCGAIAYNAAGRVSQIIYPSGRVVQVARNAEGQATAVTTKQTATAAVVNIATGISYQPMSNLLTTLTHGNGLVTTATYDLDERLTSLRVTNGATLVNGYAYAYADGMNLTGITDQLVAANSNTLAYSPANRLAVANGAWGNSTYAYDLVGNRTSEVTTLGATTTTRTSTNPATSNRLSSVAQTGSTTAFRSPARDPLLRSSRAFVGRRRSTGPSRRAPASPYDAAGNTATDARLGMTAPLAYTTNTRNRMSALSGGSPARTATYIYNALEQMISRQTNAAGAPTTIVHYIYDLDGHLIAEANGSAAGTTITSLREYIWLPANDNNNNTMAEELVAANDNNVPDLPLAVIDVAATPTISQVHTDHLGRPVRMTSAAKATTWNTVWTPWGAAHTTTGTATNNLRFPGQYFLIETGLAYNWHRSYDPATGRYTQPDPLRFVDGPSVYAYVGNSPFMRTDRDGRILDTIADIAFIGYDLYRIYQDGWCNLGDNLTALALDSGGALIPFATGLGAAYRGGKAAKSFKRFLKDDYGTVPRQSSRTLRNKWQKANDKPWPKDPDTGGNQVVSHKKALADGGDNELSNIEPLTQVDHVQKHKDAGDFVRWGSRRNN